VALVDRHPQRGAVHLAGGRVHDAAHTVLAAGQHDVQGAQHIRLHHFHRMHVGVGYRDQGAQVKDGVDALAGCQQGRQIAQIARDDLDVRAKLPGRQREQP